MEINSVGDLRTQLKRLQMQVRLLAAILVVSLALAITSGILRLDSTEESSSSILRARGLVIVDAQGHERILIGAPIPSAADRVRTDLKRAAQIWGPQFGGAANFVSYYKNVQNSMNGILILDAEGFDRIAIGNPTPDPNIGKRNTPSTGMMINDDRGFERTGYGVSKLGGQYRDVLGMDSQGGEIVDLAVLDGGDSGLMVSHGDRELLVGNSNPLQGESEPFQGLVVEQGQKVLYKLAPAAVHVPPDVLARYVGTYRLAPTFSITITREGDHLYAQPTGQPKSQIFPESATECYVQAMGAPITFVTSGGRATALTLHQGKDTTGKRVD